MIATNVFLLLHVLHVCHCNWMDDWMTPIQDQLKEDVVWGPKDQFGLRAYDDELRKAEANTLNTPKYDLRPSLDDGARRQKLKANLESVLSATKALSETLDRQILALTAKETTLKEAIANGRLGVTTVKVSTTNFAPRTYIIREGFWTLCNGIIQMPERRYMGLTDQFHELYSSPKCIGHEVSSNRDPCAFNSVIKYETIPEARALEYIEDDFLCLQPQFNISMEKYLSVPRRVVNETCKRGQVRSLEENNQECGVRTLSEYTYYPHRSSAAASLPLEYCTDQNGSCKLIVAWHVANNTVEHFEFLKAEPKFQDFFISGTNKE